MRLTNTTGPATSIIGEAPGDGATYIVGVTVTDDAGNTFRPTQCSFRTLEALSLRTTPPGDLVVGVPWVVSFTGSGGVDPYRWSLSGPAWLTLNATSGPGVTLTGTPPDALPFACRVTFQDSVGSRPQSFDCSNKAALAPLSVNIVSSACPAEPLVFGQSFGGQLRAVGGDETYSWRVNGPSWLQSVPSGGFLALSGTPDLIQEYTYTVDVSDRSGSAPARYSCTLRVIPPGIPSFSMSLGSPSTLLEPVSVILELSAPAPIALVGDVELIFVANAFATTDNPQVQWVEPAGQRRLFTFQIPAGARSIVLGRFQLGTVAGVASITLTGLRGGGISLLPGLSAGQVTVPVLPPVLTDIAFESETPTGFTIVATGFSTPRNLTSATVTFNPRPGSQLTGSAGFTIDLTTTSRTYYQTAESLEGGSTFVLRFPVTITGNKADIASISVVFTNSVGQSTVITRDR
ncbi:MAG: hypothetical protein SGI92_14065 [Bryobacteraceae bacterium]|nr:hypothetical protein [Bryobacteraceae bacterium]